MPVVDMPLAELKKYRGINPKPKDFDEYWDRALKELDSVDPKLSITESSFKFPGTICNDMYFNGTKGGRVYAKLAVPKNMKKNSPAVLFFHGYSGSSGEWTNYTAYAQAGFVVAALDCRGQAGQSDDLTPVCGNTLNGHIIRGLENDNPDDLYFRQVFLDTVRLAQLVSEMENVDKTKICVAGGSQGGGLTLACAALAPFVTMAAPQYPFLSDYRRVWDMDMDERAYTELRRYFKDFDPLHEREDEIFTKLGYIDIQHLADRIKAKVLFATGLMDNVCPPSTQFAVYNKIKSEKSMLIYPDFGHEYLPHFSEKTAGMFLQLLD